MGILFEDRPMALKKLLSIKKQAMSMLRLFDHPYGKEYFHRTFKSICKRGVRRIDKLRPLLAFSLSRGQTKH